MVPVLGREVVECKQSVPVLGQAGDRFVVFAAVFVGEHVDSGLSCRASRRAVNLTKVCLHVDLDRKRDLVQPVGGLVNPTPLVLGAREALFQMMGVFAEFERSMM